MIPRDQHGDVCQELEEALKREQHAQELLQEQTQRINDLSQQIETQMCASDDKEQTLADAVTVSGVREMRLESAQRTGRRKGWRGEKAGVTSRPLCKKAKYIISFPLRWR